MSAAAPTAAGATVNPLSGQSGPAQTGPRGWAHFWPAEFATRKCFPSETEAFVLLDDWSANQPARLFRRPHEIIVARTLDEVIPALERVRAGLHLGFHAAGYLAYEAGFALEPKLRGTPFAPGPLQLVWFGLFDAPQALGLPSSPGQPRPEGTRTFAPDLCEAGYLRQTREILDLIAAGDCFQVNFTQEALVHSASSPAAIFEALRPAQKASWGGMLSTGSAGLVSCSPELFFAIDGGTIWTRPMKGTARRGQTLSSDNARKDALRSDPKERAENLMIVDLIRNDLARVARAGTVKVEQLFEVETYPTVHQLTSTVSARLDDGLDAIDVLRRLFPCGSVTGAPKIRAMEIIAQLEAHQRGPYTGSMGFIAPDGQAAFNVLIRTLEFENGSDRLRFGTGSGIVADSDPRKELHECRAKARFLDTCFPLRGGE